MKWATILSESNDDTPQAVRTRRFLIGAVAYGLGVLLIALGVWMGYAGWDALLTFLILALLVNGGFYLAFRSGFNLKAADPSLTAEQILAATACVMYIAYHAGEARGIVLLWVLVIFILGLLRLKTAQLLHLAAFALLGYGGIIWLLQLYRPESLDLRLELLRWTALGGVLVWFAFVGGYISDLRLNLRRSEAFYRGMWETTVDAVVIADQDAIIRYANPAVASVFGYSPDQLIGKEAWSLRAPAVREKSIAGFRSYLATGIRGRDWKAGEVKCLHRDGREFQAEVSIGEMNVEGWRAFLYFTRDITERNRVEKARSAIERSNDQLRSAIEQLNESVVLTDAEDRFVLTNHAFRELNRNVAAAIEVGCKFEDYLRADIAAGNYPDAAGREEAWLQQRLAERRNPSGPVEGVRPGDRWFLIADKRLPDGGMIRFGSEITKRKRVEQALERAYSEQKLIFDRSVVGIAFIKSRIFERCNRRMEEIFGYGPGEMHGQSTRIYFASQEEFEAMGVRVLEELHRGDTVIIESIYKRRNGELIWARLNGTAIDAANPLAGSIWAFEDITDRKQAELELKDAKERIERMNAELEDRVAARTVELEALVKELETFNYAVAHDLNTSLGVMSVNAGMLLHDLGEHLTEDARRALGRITENAQQVARLLDDLLEYSRLGREAIERGPVAMRDLVTDAWRPLARAETGRQVSFEAGELPECTGDRRMFAQLWSQLFSNALKYTRTRAQARVEAGYDAAKNAYFVRDNGVGFDMQYADKLFNVFERLHRDERFEGTGIGLAIAARIVRRHGGRIWAEARLEEGAAFYFTIP